MRKRIQKVRQSSHCRKRGNKVQQVVVTIAVTVHPNLTQILIHQLHQAVQMMRAVPPARPVPVAIRTHHPIPIEKIYFL